MEKELTRNNRFYPLPGELGKDEFLTRLFTPLSGNLNLCIRLSETLQQVAGIYQANTSGTEDTDAFNQLYRESLFKAYTTINRFRTLIEEDELTVQSETFRRLLVKVLSATNIPFHGEPAIGMQVMGVLEHATWISATWYYYRSMKAASQIGRRLFLYSLQPAQSFRNDHHRA